MNGICLASQLNCSGTGCTYLGFQTCATVLLACQPYAFHNHYLKMVSYGLTSTTIVYCRYIVGLPIRLQWFELYRFGIPDIYHGRTLPFPGIAIVNKKGSNGYNALDNTMDNAMDKCNQSQDCAIDTFIIGFFQ